MNTYPITDINKNHEWQHIRTVLHNNNYPTHKHQRKHKPNHMEQNTSPKNKPKLASFTYSYVGKKPGSSQDYLRIQTYELLPEPRRP
jgi:hypothetical protein